MAALARRSTSLYLHRRREDQATSIETRRAGQVLPRSRLAHVRPEPNGPGALGAKAMTDIEQVSKDFVRAAERSTTLYALSEEYLHLVELLEDPDVETEMIEWELDQISGAIAKKAESIAGLIHWYEGLAELRKFESKRMADSVAGFQRQADRLRAYLLRNMQLAEMTRIDTSRFTLSVRQNPPRVEVLEQLALPPGFLRHIPEQWEPNKKAIIDHWKQTGE